jgi:RNA polymerase sigma factor (sigma-70 family)
MVEKREDAINRPEVKRLRELQDELKTIIARYKGERYDPREFDLASARVYAAILREAKGILWPVFGNLAAELAENARAHWWISMQRGGFSRYDDSVDTVTAYAYGSLRKICFSRANLAKVLGRRRKRREPDDMDRTQPDNSPRKREPDRRQVPLPFDPIDPHSTGDAERRDRADFAWILLNKLSPDDRELLTRRHIRGEDISALARKLGITRQALDTRLSRARKTARERFKDFEW